MKAPLHVRELNRAREWYNPLRGLDIQRVVALLEEAERGKYDDLQKLNRMAEKRHPALRALKHRRLSALKKLDWDVKVPSELPDGVTEAQADAQRKFLRSRYEAIENLPQAIEFLALATFRGFSHLEPHYQDDDAGKSIIRLVPVPQWHWLRDSQDFGIWRYDADARGNETTSVVVDQADFIIREVEDPLCEIALLCFLRRNLAKKNWTAFQDDYAIPSIFAMLGENTPRELVKEWLELVKKVTNNSRGALPPGSKVATLEAGNLDGVQFKNFIEAEDQDLILAGTSGKLTMLTASTGLNSDQADTHEATFDELALAEAQEISAILQAQHDKRILALEFPSQPVLAYFQLAAEDKEDVGALADRTQKFFAAGFVADEEEISEKAGMTLRLKQPAPADAAAGTTPAAGAEPNPPFGNRATGADVPAKPAVQQATTMRLMANGGRALSAADRVALKPVIDRVAALVDLNDAELPAALEKLRTDLPDLEAQCLGDKASEALDTAFTDILATAFRNGLEQGAADRRKPAPNGRKSPEGVSQGLPQGQSA